MAITARKFFDDIRGRRIAVMGIGVSHTELIIMLQKRGALVTACDKRTRAELGETAEMLEEAGVPLNLGSSYFDNPDAEIVFRTPGMHFHLPQLEELRRRGVAVTSEMEVFFDVCPCPIIAVTGSDGKTTTTTLIAEMLKAQGKTVHLGGNIGRALLPHVFEMRESDVAVVELSSFQLISMRSSPQTAVITNITPNHLDMHRDMQEYVDAKRNIFLHQNAFSRTVLCRDNDITAGFAPEVRGQCMLFSREQPVETGAFLDENGSVCSVKNGIVSHIMDSADIRLPGAHNKSNYLAAICATEGFVEAETIRRVAREFAGVEHRIEFVRIFDGVSYYNDSIATTPTRAIAGLKSFGKKIILIAGGYDKKIPYEPLAPEIVNSVKLLILTGATAAKIEAAVLAHPAYTEGSPVILHAGDLAHAVQLARQKAQGGDIVSLSPASASFDAFKNFEERGRRFKELVHAL